MYQYTFTLGYIGSSVFIIALWNKLTRNTGVMALTISLTPTQVTTLRADAATQGFTFTNISRTLVPIVEPVA